MQNKTQRAIILAAGIGSRLFPLTQDTPKCLVDLGGTSLLQKQLELLHEGGVPEVIIATGGFSQKITDFLARHNFGNMKIVTEYNPFYYCSNNLTSLWMMRFYFNKPFLLLNGDIAFDSKSLSKILNAEDDISLGLRRTDDFDEDDMKVIANNGLVQRIGKQLDPKLCNSESLGMIYFSKKGGQYLREKLEAQILNKDNINRFYLLSIQSLIDDGKTVHACDLSGGQWYELDFPDDYQVLKEKIHLI